MKEPPSQTFAFLLQDLYAIPGEFIACLEWQRIPSDRMRRDAPEPPAPLLQQARVDRELRLAGDAAGGDARRRLRERHGAAARRRADGTGGQRPLLRQCSLDARAARRPTPRALQHQTAEAMKAMAVHDGSLFEETYNLLNAWLSIVPGNGAHNLRRLALLETNLRGPELPVHARPRRTPSARTWDGRRWRSSRRRITRRTPSTCTSRTSGTRWSSAPPAAARASC